MSDKKPDVTMTAEAIISIAKTMEDYAQELRRIGKQMIEREDLTYAGEAMQAVKNCYGNLRTDLLVTRPLRELGQ